MSISGLKLHHVSIVVTDLARSTAFYSELFGLPLLPRPPFNTAGAWLAAGPNQIHLIAHPAGTRRALAQIDSDDLHFAFNTTDFEGFMRHATALGFREDADPDDPKRLLVRRKGAAGFPQVFLIDPDNNIIEVNGAA